MRSTSSVVTHYGQKEYHKQKKTITCKCMKPSFWNWKYALRLNEGHTIFVLMHFKPRELSKVLLRRLKKISSYSWFISRNRRKGKKMSKHRCTGSTYEHIMFLYANTLSSNSSMSNYMQTHCDQILQYPNRRFRRVNSYQNTSNAT